MVSQSSPPDQILFSADGPSLLGNQHFEVWFGTAIGLFLWVVSDPGGKQWVCRMGHNKPLGIYISQGTLVYPSSQPASDTMFSPCRTGERPEHCQVSLSEFQQFLLEYQGVWLGQGARMRSGFIVGGLFMTSSLSKRSCGLWTGSRCRNLCSAFFEIPCERLRSHTSSWMR